MAVIAVLLLLAVVDLGAKSLAQSQLASAANSRSKNVGSVTVRYKGLPDEISGFPFAWDILRDGKVGDATIELHQVSVAPMSMKLVRAQVKDLAVGRGALVANGRAVSGTGPVRVTVVLGAKDLSSYFSQPVQLRSGYFHGMVDDVVIDGKVSVDGRKIVVNDKENAPVAFDMPSRDYLPCTPSGVSVGSGGIVLSCTSPTLPKAVAAVVGDKKLRGAS